MVVTLTPPIFIPDVSPTLSILYNQILGHLRGGNSNSKPRPRPHTCAPWLSETEAVWDNTHKQHMELVSDFQWTENSNKPHCEKDLHNEAPSPGDFFFLDSFWIL